MLAGLRYRSGRLAHGHGLSGISDCPARAQCKVVLSGTGGDEFHGGYVGRYQALGLTQMARLQPGTDGWTCGDACAERAPVAVGQSQSVPQALQPVDPDSLYRTMLNFVVKPEHMAMAFTPEFLRGANGYNANTVMEQFLQRCPSTDWRDRVVCGRQDLPCWLADVGR